MKFNVSPKDLSGKVILLTGGNEGIGYNTAIQLAKMNAEVIIASRNKEKSIKAVENIKNLSGNDKIGYRILDLSSIQGVKDFAEDFKKDYSKLDLLINNSGGLFMSYGETQDGLEQTLHINHIGGFILTLSLLPIIEKAENPRIINLSSEAHAMEKIELPISFVPKPKEYNAMKEYSRSKLMNVLFTKELAKRLANKNIIVAAVHPGFVNSQFGRDSVNNPILNFAFNSAMYVVSALFARNGEEGAKTTIFAATDDSIKSGEYYDSCAVGVVQPQGHDEDLAFQLWEESAKVAGFDPNIV
ncbi:dehydrogenase/reductase sdr family member 13 [Conidiobolus coronatus NRRL 28638]|uniref:Dehydrogenase/reductase sdr family member 13 n=1 Tax=Conidiobolus coronatus (strain ATCC 28846 / CBS 209.66 / NRRL 28638) TaxID=796925 RepID=A0A137P1A2_CONC2|nr:dehydrogenase/reductase sdr family member 13 [Conidiobolus coronatus NRRL 28638]|eukprot:KXN68850.1 dehydrogenase/reductase sdr family member 13 [Conidiobolus coronatus NRRL 28638]